MRALDGEITLFFYLKPMSTLIKACVEKGKVTSLMCSYNAVNGRQKHIFGEIIRDDYSRLVLLTPPPSGVPSCANDWLLTSVAREEWGFDGYITSDCDADSVSPTLTH